MVPPYLLSESKFLIIFDKTEDNNQLELELLTKFPA